MDRRTTTASRSCAIETLPNSLIRLRDTNTGSVYLFNSDGSNRLGSPVPPDHVRAAVAGHIGGAA